MGKNNTKHSKLLTVITYVIALLCLVAGLFIPLGNAEGFIADNMLGWQLPKAINSLFHTELNFGAEFTYGIQVNFFGMEAGFDIGALLCLLYFAFTIVAIIGLIPVIVSKKRAVAIKAASFAEIISLVILACLVLNNAYAYSITAGAVKVSYALLIAFGGTLLMLIVQAFSSKGGSGFVKFFLLLLSAISVAVVIYPITALIPALQDVLPMDLLVNSVTGNGLGLVMFASIFVVNPFAGLEMTNIILMLSIILSVGLVLLNSIIDMMGLGKRTRGYMLIGNLVRYSLEIVAVVLAIIMAFVVEGATAGVFDYILAGIAIVQLLINVFRFVRFRKVKKLSKSKKSASVKNTVNNAVSEAESVEDIPATAPSMKDIDEELRMLSAAAKTPEASSVKAPEAPVIQPEASEPLSYKQYQPVYNVEPIYNGPMDEFIKLLTNTERIEFAQTFLERSKGNIPNISDYIVGGNNNKFFSSIFIYYGRVRDLVSDGLMNKIFEYANTKYQ